MFQGDGQELFLPWLVLVHFSTSSKVCVCVCMQILDSKKSEEALVSPETLSEDGIKCLKFVIKDLYGVLED